MQRRCRNRTIAANIPDSWRLRSRKILTIPAPVVEGTSIRQTFLFPITGHMRHVYRFRRAKWWSTCLRAWFIDWYAHRSELHLCAAHSIAYALASSVQCIAICMYMYICHTLIYVYIWVPRGFIQLSFPYSLEMHYWHSDNRIAHECYWGNQWGYDE